MTVMSKDEARTCDYTLNTISVFLIQKETETRNTIKHKTNKQISKRKKQKNYCKRASEMAQQERALEAKLVEHGRRGEQTVVSSPLTSKHDTCTHIYTCTGAQNK